jgi:hypothetical protein
MLFKKGKHNNAIPKTTNVITELMGAATGLLRY